MSFFRSRWVRPPAHVSELEPSALPAGFRAAGVAAGINTLGRPTCMSVPAAMAMGTVASTGCVGNRVYTNIDPGDLYAVVPGRHLECIAEETATIRRANLELLGYHTGRRERLMSIG